ncbi:MAG: penicillin-binding protein 2, partial [Verrucomicrobiota bacterium]
RDRTGLPLATNRRSYAVDFYLPDMVRSFKKENGWVPLTHFKAPVHQMLAEKSEADVVEILNLSILPRLRTLSLAYDYNAARLQKHYRTNAEVPFPYQEGLDFPTVAKFAEHNINLPGVEITLRPVRHYVYGALAAHLLGYVGAPVEIEKLPDVNAYTFYQPDLEGKAQIEQSMEAYLRGTPGRRLLERSAKGIIGPERRTIPPIPGNTVYLTIDARIQFIAEEALRHPGLGRAAAVVLDPNNGDILAMSSVPSFDPNVFIPSVTAANWRKLMEDEAVPLVNRAVSGFPPGSIFKIITAMAGLQRKLGGARFNCPGGVQYGNHYFHCWISEKHRTHGILGLSDALKVSCDSYFYQYANAAGIESIDRLGALFGLGQIYDIGLSDEKAGCMPGPEWMRLRAVQEKWTSAHTANVAIGQGYVLTSPLQMAIAYAAVANGGIVYEPRLVKAVATPEGRTLLNENGQPAVLDQPRIRADLRTEFTPAQIQAIRYGLWEVVNEAGGTGGRARIEGVTVAGKTGTAQATDRGKEDYIAWFCCFAPYERPRYVIVTMVQSGAHGGSVAAPIAAHILERCLAMDQGSYKVALQPLNPARGAKPFQAIEALSFKEGRKVMLNAAVSPEPPVTPDPPVKLSASVKPDPPEKPRLEGSATVRKEPSRSSAQARIQLTRGRSSPPAIRPEPDQRGRIVRRSILPTYQPPPPPPVDRRNFFQRLFGLRKPAPSPRPLPPARRPFLH